MLEKWFIDSDLLCYYKPSCGVLILYSNRFGVVTISYMTLGLEVLENFSLREKSLQIQISDFSIANEIFFASCPQIISHLAPFLLSTPTRAQRPGRQQISIFFFLFFFWGGECFCDKVP